MITTSMVIVTLAPSRFFLFFFATIRALLWGSTRACAPVNKQLLLFFFCSFSFFSPLRHAATREIHPRVVKSTKQQKQQNKTAPRQIRFNYSFTPILPTYYHTCLDPESTNGEKTVKTVSTLFLPLFIFTSLSLCRFLHLHAPLLFVVFLAFPLRLSLDRIFYSKFFFY